MASVDGGRLVARALAKEKVTHLFTLCGGHIMPIYEGCLDLGIRVIDVRHEQAAAMAADGMARVTGRPAVAAVTAGPGVANAVTGVLNAHQSDSPIVVLGGQGEVAKFGMGALQESPHVEMMRPVTKYAASVVRTDRIPEYVGTAFRHATAPRTGPAFLELPWDVLFENADEEKVRAWDGYRTPFRTAPDPRGVAEAARLLASAERPVIVAGTGVRWCDAGAAVSRFAAALRAPVFLNGLARGSVPPTNPHYFGLARGAAIRRADLVVNVGTPLDFRMGYGEPSVIPKDARLVTLDVDATAIGHNRGVDVGLACDVGLGLEALAAELKRATVRDRAAWLAEVRAMEEKKRAEFEPGFASDDRPMHVHRFCKELAAFVDDDTIVVGDGGNVVATAAKVMQARKPGHWLDPGRFGCLGVGLPFAMAAKLAKPECKVLVVSGDGSFGLNGFEFDTLVRHGIPVVTVIGNDGAWTQIRAPQTAFYGVERAVGSALSLDARYDRFAEAMGGFGERVDSGDALRSAVKRAFDSGKPAIVDALIDAASNVGSGTYM